MVCFSAIHNSSEQLLSILKPIVSFAAEEVNMEIDKFGITIRVVNPNSELLIDIFLDSDDFVSYKFKYKRGIKIGIIWIPTDENTSMNLQIYKHKFRQ